MEFNTNTQDILKLKTYFERIIGEAMGKPITVSNDEIVRIQEGIPFDIVQYAIRKTAKWVERIIRTQPCPPSARKILTSVRDTASYSLSKCSKESPGLKNLITYLREDFQRDIGDHHPEPFCLTDVETSHLLGKYGRVALRNTFPSVGTWLKMADPTPSQQEVVDRLYFVLEMSNEAPAYEHRN